MDDDKLSTASGGTTPDDVDPDGSLLRSMLARQAVMDSPHRDTTAGRDASPRTPARDYGGHIAARSRVASVRSGGSSATESEDMGTPWAVDGDPDELEDAITAARVQQAERERIAQSAFARVGGRSKRRTTPGKLALGGLGETSLAANSLDESLLLKATHELVVKELYPSVEKDLYSPNYWTHWNTEAVASKGAAAQARETLQRKEQVRKEESRRGMKGVKLAVQWQLDHPFRQSNKFGKGPGPSAFLDSDTPKCYVPEKDFLSEFRMPLQKPPLPSGTCVVTAMAWSGLRSTFCGTQVASSARQGVPNWTASRTSTTTKTWGQACIRSRVRWASNP